MSAGDALGEEDAEDVAPWSMPGMDEELLEEPQAASVSARAVAAPAAARLRRRAVNRQEVVIAVGVFPGGRTTPVARGNEQDTVPVPACDRGPARVVTS
ncbi:hypothetical protein ACWCOW_43035, partial [Streptomyces sp. NPDC001939]